MQTFKVLTAYSRPQQPAQIVILSPCTRGGYYLGAPDIPEDSFYRPFVQVGQKVSAGEPLCRIKEKRFRGSEQYVILSPEKGVVLERIIENKHLVTRGGMLTVTEGFAVLFGEPLFLLGLGV